MDNMRKIPITRDIVRKAVRAYKDGISALPETCLVAQALLSQKEVTSVLVGPYSVAIEGKSYSMPRESDILKARIWYDHASKRNADKTYKRLCTRGVTEISVPERMFSNGQKA